MEGERGVGQSNAGPADCSAETVRFFVREVPSLDFLMGLWAFGERCDGQTAVARVSWEQLPRARSWSAEPQPTLWFDRLAGQTLADALWGYGIKAHGCEEDLEQLRAQLEEAREDRAAFRDALVRSMDALIEKGRGG
jgi:hypothetical protein